MSKHLLQDVVLDKLCLPPGPVPNKHGALLKDFQITRVAKVRMHWNDAKCEWEWEPPEGVSNYYKSLPAEQPA